MTDQLQAAIQITQARIADLEGELRREREFLNRLIPGEIRPQPPRRANFSPHWLAVLAAVAAKPMRHEHIIDLIEEKGFPMTRGATRVWLNDRVKRGYLKRDKVGVYTVTAAGQEWIKASAS